MIDPSLIAERTAAYEMRDTADKRIVAADAAILAVMNDGDMVTTHPTDVPVIMRVGNEIKDGLLKSVHALQ